MATDLSALHDSWLWDDGIDHVFHMLMGNDAAALSAHAACWPTAVPASVTGRAATGDWLNYGEPLSDHQACRTLIPAPPAVTQPAEPSGSPLRPSASDGSAAVSQVLSTGDLTLAQDLSRNTSAASGGSHGAVSTACILLPPPLENQKAQLQALPQQQQEQQHQHQHHQQQQQQQQHQQQGWQELLADFPPAVLAATQPPVAQAPARGRPGRKPTGLSKPCKDKKRENTIKIRGLEAELEAKLRLPFSRDQIQDLESKNEHLKRRERLLKLSVNMSEHNINKKLDHQLAPNLMAMLGSFRGICNRANAERLLAKVAHIQDPKDMTLDTFRSTWQALVGEMGDALMAEASAGSAAEAADVAAHLARLAMSVQEFIMAMCAHDIDLIIRAHNINLMTGDEGYRDTAFWGSVCDQLSLSPDQIKDILTAFQTFMHHIVENVQTRKGLQAQLAAACSDQACTTSCGLSDPVFEVTERVTANMVRCDVLHTMMSFVVLNLFTPKQLAQASMHSSPFFPNFRFMAHALAIKHGLPLHPMFDTLVEHGKERMMLANAAVFTKQGARIAA